MEDNQNQERKCCSCSFDKDLEISKSFISDKVLLGLRMFFALYFTGIYIWILNQEKIFKSLLDNIIYMTTFGFYLTWIYFFFTAQYILLQGKYQPIAKNYIQVLGAVAICLEVPVTIIYWGFLFDSSIEGAELFMQINLHVFPLLTLIIQMIFNPYLYQLWLYSFVAGVGTIYVLINLTYSLAYKPVYSVLNWKTGTSYGIVIGSYVLTFMMLGLCRLISHYCKKKAKSNQEDGACTDKGLKGQKKTATSTGLQQANKEYDKMQNFQI